MPALSPSAGAREAGREERGVASSVSMNDYNPSGSTEDGESHRHVAQTLPTAAFAFRISCKRPQGSRIGLCRTFCCALPGRGSGGGLGLATTALAEAGFGGGGLDAWRQAGTRGDWADS